MWFKRDDQREKQSVRLKTTVEASEEVSVNAAVAICYVRSRDHISSRQEQRETVKAFPDGQNVFALLLIGFLQHIIWFVDLDLLRIAR